MATKTPNTEAPKAFTYDGNRDASDMAKVWQRLGKAASRATKAGDTKAPVLVAQRDAAKAIFVALAAL